MGKLRLTKDLTMIDSLRWHKENTKNIKRHVIEQEEHLKKLTRSIEKEKEYLRFYEFQIEMAEKEGKTSFSADKYKIKRSTSKE